MLQKYFSGYGKAFKSGLQRLPSYLAKATKFLKQLEDGSERVLQTSKRIADVADRTYQTGKASDLVRRVERAAQPALAEVSRLGQLGQGLQTIF